MTPRRERIGSVVILLLTSLAIALIMLQILLSFFMEKPQ